MDDNIDKIENGKIYKITNLLTNKPCYIGQTIQSVNERFNDHYSTKNKYNISYLINTYGKSNFKIEVIQENIQSREELNKLEKEYILSYLAQYDLVNKIVYKTYDKESITVRCIETGEIFPSINMAAKKYNIHHDSINQAIKYGYQAGKDNDGNKLHWKKIGEDYEYKKYIRDEYVLYIIEQKYQIQNNNGIKNAINNKNQKITKRMKSIAVQCIETGEIFPSINLAAQKYNIHHNSINQAIKYGYQAGQDNNGNKLHWQKINSNNGNIQNDIVSNIDYEWKPIYVQQTWKKLYKTQLEFHKNNPSSVLYDILNKNDINDFRIITVQQSELEEIKNNIKKLNNIKSLNDAIEKEKYLITLLKSKYDLYNFYQNSNYIIDNIKDEEPTIININDLFNNYYKQQAELEKQILYNNQDINIQFKEIQVQCIETEEIFNTIQEAAKAYNTDIKSIVNSIKYHCAVGKLNNVDQKEIVKLHSQSKAIKLHSQHKRTEFHWREYKFNNYDQNIENEYQIYIIEQKIINNNIKEKISSIRCIETNEIFTDIKEAANKYNIPLPNLYQAVKYGYSAGKIKNNIELNIQQNEIKQCWQREEVKLHSQSEAIKLHSQNEEVKLHWMNIKQPLYELATDNNDQEIWIPIYVIIDNAISTYFNHNYINANKILEKLKNDSNCAIYNILNQLPIEDFRIANMKRYKAILSLQQEDNNNLYNYCINNIKDNHILNLIYDKIQDRISMYYNLYNRQLSSQNLINNKTTNNIDCIMWKLIKNNQYLNTEELCKSIDDNIIFLNYVSVAHYYDISINTIKNIINMNNVIISQKRKNIQLINIKELKDDTIIYANAYQIIKIQVNTKISYAISNMPYNCFIALIHQKNRPGVSKLINETDNYKCEIIKSHIYFKEEAEQIKNHLMGYKKKKFKCQFAVKCINTGEVFKSIYEANQKYGYKGEENILRVCKKQRLHTIDHKTGEKLKWEFVDNNIPTYKSVIYEKTYTVFSLYYLDQLIVISKSSLFKNSQLTKKDRNYILNKLKTNNIHFRNLLSQINKDELVFKIHKENLSFYEAQEEIKKIKLQNINNNIL